MHNEIHVPDAEDDGSGHSVAISGILFAMVWIMEKVARRRQRGQALVVLMDCQKSLYEAVKLRRLQSEPFRF